MAILAAGVALPAGIFVFPEAGWAVFCAALVLQILLHGRNFPRMRRGFGKRRVDDRLNDGNARDGVFECLTGRDGQEKPSRGPFADHDCHRDMLIAAVQALTDGVVLLDQQYRLLFCNTKAESQLGVLARIDRGQPIGDLVRQPEFLAYLQAADFVRPLSMRSERNIDLVLSIHVIPCADNRWLMQIKDVTQADLLDRMRRDFVANVSHELRTPLTVLAGFLETLLEIDLDGEEQRRYLEMMSEQSARMQSIMQDLLALSSIESAPPPEDAVVDMANVVDKLRRDAESLSAGRHRIVIEADGQVDLRGSETELVSAFTNLVANAVRYTPAGGTVTISWRADARGAEFAVQDTGIGIDPKHIPRLTERFYRVDRGRSRDAGGTGLGLAIVKHSLGRHQVHLDIKSTPGVGSRFAARFPASRVTGA